MILSYETTFKLWFALFLAAGAAPFFFLSPGSVAPYQINRQIIPRGKTPPEAYLIATRGKNRI